MELLGRKFKVTMINMLKAVMQRIGNMCEQIANFSRTIATEKESNGNGKNKNITTDKKKSLGSLVELTWLRIESVNLKIQVSRNYPNRNTKRKKQNKTGEGRGELWYII